MTMSDKKFKKIMDGLEKATKGWVAGGGITLASIGFISSVISYIDPFIMPHICLIVVASYIQNQIDMGLSCERQE